VGDPLHDVEPPSCFVLEHTDFDFEEVRVTCAKASAAFERFRQEAVASDRGKGSGSICIERTASTSYGDDLSWTVEDWQKQFEGLKKDQQTTPLHSRFLLLEVCGVKLLVSRDATTWLIDPAENRGVRYWFSKDLNDIEASAPPAYFPEFVYGIDAGDGWLRVFHGIDEVKEFILHSWA
jgi:hypothetical protein